MRYNGHTFDEFNVAGTSGLVEQLDNLLPQLTVLETLQFAQTCQVGGSSRGRAWDNLLPQTCQVGGSSRGRAWDNLLPQTCQVGGSSRGRDAALGASMEPYASSYVHASTSDSSTNLYFRLPTQKGLVAEYHNFVSQIQAAISGADHSLKIGNKCPRSCPDAACHSYSWLLSEVVKLRPKIVSLSGRGHGYAQALPAHAPDCNLTVTYCLSCLVCPRRFRSSAAWGADRRRAPAPPAS